MDLRSAFSKDHKRTLLPYLAALGVVVAAFLLEQIYLGEFKDKMGRLSKDQAESCLLLMARMAADSGECQLLRRADASAGWVYYRPTRQVGALLPTEDVRIGVLEEGGPLDVDGALPDDSLAAVALQTGTTLWTDAETVNGSRYRRLALLLEPEDERPLTVVTARLHSSYEEEWLSWFRYGMVLKIFLVVLLIVFPTVFVIHLARRRRLQEFEEFDDSSQEREGQAAQPTCPEILRQLVVGNENSGLVLLDSEMRVMYANRLAREVLEMSSRESKGSPVRSLPCFDAEQKAALEKSIPVEREEWQITHCDGSRLTVRLSLFPIKTQESEDIYCLAVDDVTELLVSREERKKLMQKKMTASSLSVLTTVVRGFAHDLNNLLAGIVGAASLGQVMHDGGSPEAQRYAAILKAAERATSIGDELLQAARMKEGEHRPLDPSEEMEEISEALRSVLPSSMTLEVDVSSDLPLMIADRYLLRQIFYGLALRSSESTEGKGRVTITMESVKEPEMDSRFSERTGPLSVLPSICIGFDDGTIIPPGLHELLEAPDTDPARIEAAYGATMASVYQAVGAQRGRIIVHRERMATTLYVLLRAAERAVEERVERGTAELSGEGVSVLVAEEEPLVRETTKQILEHYGFRVAGAGSGDEALAVFEHERFDVLILDMNMPGTPSTEVARVCHQRWPDMSILLTSGYESPVMPDAEVEALGSGFLRKPYLPETLARKVLELLARRSEEQR